MNKSQVHYTQGDKPDSKGHISYDFVCVNILEQATLQGLKTDECSPGAVGKEKRLVTNGPKETFCNDGHVGNLDVGGFITVFCIC